MASQMTPRISTRAAWLCAAISLLTLAGCAGGEGRPRPFQVGTTTFDPDLPPEEGSGKERREPLPERHRVLGTRQDLRVPPERVHASRQLSRPQCPPRLVEAVPKEPKRLNQVVFRFDGVARFV